MPRSVYRIVRSNPPREQDFQSYASLGVLLVHDDAQSRRFAEGISVYTTRAQARRAARSMPRLGEWIAELTIPDDAPATLERTGRKPGHHTLWGLPVDVVGWVHSVVSVGEELA